MDSSTWYAKLAKPRWAPPSWIFGPVWSVLYIVIFVSFGLVFFRAFQGEVPWLAALPFGLNLLFNFLFTPLQFGLKSNSLALADILLTWAALVWAMAAIFPYMPWVAYVNIPYLLWVSFATVLQGTITYLNINQQKELE